MADRFIDQDETQIYGPYAAKRIQAKLLGLVPEYDDALKFSASQLDAHTAAVSAAVSAAREKDASLRQGSHDKAPILEKARRLLGQFAKHLAAHDAGVVDRKVFFVKDGTVAGVGRAAPDVLLAITRITTKLDDPKCPVRDLAHWHARFDAAMKELAPVVAFADDARVDRQSLTPEVEASRQAWLSSYIATKALVESLLRHLGRLEQMPLFFYDLRVPAGTKVTEPPPEA
jgi:hypothetical protein